MNTPANLKLQRSSDRFFTLAEQALQHWPIQVSALNLIKHRENAVFAVTTGDGEQYALRVHRAGYHTAEELQSELQWMQALDAAGLHTATVIPSADGALFHRVRADEQNQEILCDLLAWVDGKPLGTIEDGVNEDTTSIERTFRIIGATAARLHNHAEHWTPPAGFRRHAWDIGGIVGENPFWGRYWKNRLLTSERKSLLLRAGERLAVALQEFGQTPDRYGLIHADFLPENFLVDGDRITLIDFDDAGYGWHLFDFATTLFFHLGESHFDLIRDSMVDGYRDHRELPDAHLDMLTTFLLARGLTYVGWLHTRRETETALEIGPLVVDSVCELAEEFLANV